jgi:hypothetical protein
MATEQTAYVGDDIKVLVNVIDSTGSHVAATINTSTTRLNGFSTAPTINTIATGIYEIVFASVTPAPAEGDRLVAKINGDIGGTAWSEYGIPVKIVADERGTDNASTFDHTTDQVTVATNNDKTGYSISGTKQTLDALNDIAATDIVSNGAITTLSGAVVNVDLVDVTTTNTDMVSVAGLSTFDHTTDQVVASNMRGTDGANTVAPDNATITAINAKTSQLNFTVANQVDANSLTGGTSPADIYTYFTTGTNEDVFKADVSGIATAVAALNDLSEGDIRTAIGLATANLDTQLGNIPTVTEFEARTLLAASYFDPSVDTVTVGSNNDKTGYELSSAGNDAIGAAFLAYTLTKGTAGTIERAFWQALKTQTLTDGEVAGTPTATAFDTNLTATSGAYDHLLLVFTSGALAGEARPIDSYTATNGRIVLQEALTATPSAADEFIVVPNHVTPVEEIVAGVWADSQVSSLMQTGVAYTATAQSGDTIQVTIT